MIHPEAPNRTWRIGTRGSALARWQATTALTLLERRWPGQNFELVVVTPEGDRDKTSPLTAIGGRGVFSSALQERLLSGAIDFAVHSTKDVPGLSPAGLTLAAFPQREDARDALISRHRLAIDALPPQPVIGTSSRRRSAQVRQLRPDAEIRELRGNIDTRLRKSETDYDAILLASAGLNRMGWSGRITTLLPVEMMVPAPGQGALVIETRVAPDPAHELAAALDDPTIRAAVECERAFLRGVGGGCTTPLGAHATPIERNGQVLLRLFGMLASDDEAIIERVEGEFTLDCAEDGAFDLAADLLRIIRRRGGDTTPMTRTVLVTGSGDQGTALAAALADRGIRAIHSPMIRTVPIERPGLASMVGRADWIAVTSSAAVPALTGALDGWGARPRIAVVGQRTADALLAQGLSPDLTSSGAGAVALATDLATVEPPPESVLYLSSDAADHALEEALGAVSIRVERVNVYRTVPADAFNAEAARAMAEGYLDAIAFASPSAVRRFVELAGADLAAVSGAAFVAIGNTTADALRSIGLPVHAVSSHPTPTDFANAISSIFTGQSGTGSDS